MSGSQYLMRNCFGLKTTTITAPRFVAAHAGADERADWVDYAKAIGIILVVYGHVARGLINSGIGLEFESYKIVDSIVYSFHMPLFFFLSGLHFFRSLDRRSGTGLILNKVDTVFYPYVLWSLLQGGVEVFLSSYTNGKVSVSEVLVLLWSPRAQFWFLYALFLIFIFATVFFSVMRRQVVLGVLLALTMYFSLSFFNAPLLVAFVFNNFVFFVAGVAFSAYISPGWLASLPSVVLLMAGFIGFQWFFHFHPLMSYENRGGHALILAMISILAVVTLSRWLATKGLKLIVSIGMASMAIYLLHILVGSGVRIVLGRVLDIKGFVPHLLLGVAAAIVIPMLFLHIVQRFRIPFVFSAPISKFLKSFRSGKERRAIS